MPTQLQLRRGNTAQTAVFTGALAEITVDTTRQTLIIHDGVTAGGTPLSTLSFTQAAYDAANAAGSSATVTAAFLQANSAFLHANSAYGSQNTTGTYANSAYTQANTGTTNALAASTYANSAFTTANSAGSYANSAFAAANTAETNATAAYNFATVGNVTANAAYNQANTATTNAATADSKAVTAGSYANSAYTQANTATTDASTADSKAVTAGSYANSAYTQANTATTNALAASTYANAAFIQANAVFQYANTLSPEDNVARYTANSAALYANGAFVQANGASIYANGAFTQANAAFSVANSALPSSGGTITGSLSVTENVSITGNLTILGSTTSINTSSFTVNDSMLTLGLGNYTSDILDIGFTSHYNNGTNAHTGLIRDAGIKEWLFFEGYTPELTPNNNIVITDPSFAYANVAAKTFKGNVIANTVNVNGYDAFTYISDAYTQANAAYAAANAAGSSATVTAAFLQANSAFIKANSAYVRANNSLNANTGGTVAGPIVVDNGSYGSVTLTQFASVWGQASGPNAYSIVQTRSNDNASGIGMQAYAASYGLLFANTGIQINTGVTLRDKDYPTGGTNAGQFAANGAFISQASIASTSNSTGSIQVVGGVGVKGNVYADAVYVNGVEVLTQANAAFLQANNAYTTANNALPKAGGELTGTVSSTNSIIAPTFTANTSVSLNGVGFDSSNTYTTSSTSQVTVDLFPTTTYRSARYFVQMTSGTDYHVIELIVVHDGATVYLTQYGEVFTNATLGSFDASISSGNVNLLFTPTNSVTAVKLIRRSIIV